MVAQQSGVSQEMLESWRAKVEQARESGDTRELIFALVSLGEALFRQKNFDEGLPVFTEALSHADELGDTEILVQCLVIKSTVFQDVERFHEAFEDVARIVEIADAAGDDCMKCDALLTQAQILTNSGEPLIAMRVLREARSLAEVMDDQRRIMNVLGATGSFNLAIASVNQAIVHFDQALEIAVALGDKQAECSYLMNKGTVLFWQEQYAQALPVLERVCTLAQELNDPAVELGTLQQIAEGLAQLEDPERSLAVGTRGMALALQLDDSEAYFKFVEAAVLGGYKLGKVDDAHRVLQEATAYAHAKGDLGREINLQINLGEGCMVANLHQEALRAYNHALEGARRMNRLNDEAYLLGRLGVVHAEMGEIEHAIVLHQQSAELANQHRIPELEGEQLSMLALAYVEQGDRENALANCRQAIEVYGQANLENEQMYARQLETEIMVAIRKASQD